MTIALHLGRAVLVGLGLATSLPGVARSDDPANASRDSIIQGVRDDVRRKIKERESKPAEARSNEIDDGPTSRTRARKPPRTKPN